MTTVKTRPQARLSRGFLLLLWRIRPQTKTTHRRKETDQAKTKNIEYICHSRIVATAFFAGANPLRMTGEF
ncbi:MAG: hypothetical protein EA394_10900 [Bacteroidia bacterium]|nr:MAG: hypothetical protein EA394_10900 [Bacteroidia bacterium]